MSQTADTSELRTYYERCLGISLERQVRNIYFVSAANATRIFFLKDAAIEFLSYTGRADTGNKLERSVYEKLLSSVEMTRVKIGSLMFYHVYADLVMLSKSTILEKSVTDMNIHYLELSLFLHEAEKHPEIILNKDYNVFRSEKQLYGDNEKVNYRLRSKSQCVSDHLFSSDSECDINTMYKFSQVELLITIL